MDVIKATVCMNDDCDNKAVMDLVFGEEAEQARVPWCAHCICPVTWDLHPFHHAESYSHDKKEISVEKCEVIGCPFNARPYDNLCEEHAEHVRKKLVADQSVTKEPQCTKCGEPANVAALGDMYCTPCYNATIAEKQAKYKKEDSLGAIIEETQKVIGNIAEVIKENFVPKMPSSLGTIEKTTEEAFSKAFKVDENYSLQGSILAKDLNAPKLTIMGGHAPNIKGAKADSIEFDEVYTRQPHYEGGIDPITYGKDNFTTEEMNGFYKMNVVKYVSRCDRKNGLEDLKKAQDYLNLLIESYEIKHEIDAGVKKLKAERDKRIDFVHSKENADEVMKKSEFFMEKCERLGKERAEREAKEMLHKEAELCVQAFHRGETVEIKRKDVLNLVEANLKGNFSYSLMTCGDGTYMIERNEEA